MSSISSVWPTETGLSVMRTASFPCGLRASSYIGTFTHRFSRRSNLRAGTEQFPEPGAYASHDGKESTPTQHTTAQQARADSLAHRKRDCGLLRCDSCFRVTR